MVHLVFDWENERYDVGLDFNYTYENSLQVDHKGEFIYTRRDTLLDVYNDRGELLISTIAGLDSRDKFNVTKGRTLALKKALSKLGAPRMFRALVWEEFHKQVRGEHGVRKTKAVKKAIRLLTREGYNVIK